jgi:hypothetical protein
VVVVVAVVLRRALDHRDRYDDRGALSVARGLRRSVRAATYGVGVGVRVGVRVGVGVRLAVTVARRLQAVAVDELRLWRRGNVAALRAAALVIRRRGLSITVACVSNKSHPVAATVPQFLLARVHT